MIGIVVVTRYIQTIFNPQTDPPGSIFVKNFACELDSLYRGVHRLAKADSHFGQNMAKKYILMIVALFPRACKALPIHMDDI